VAEKPAAKPPLHDAKYILLLISSSVFEPGLIPGIFTRKIEITFHMSLEFTPIYKNLCKTDTVTPKNIADKRSEENKSVKTLVGVIFLSITCNLAKRIFENTIGRTPCGSHLRGR
jgi:hypothetical protein